MHQSHQLRKNRVSLPFHYYTVTIVSNHRKPIFAAFDIAHNTIQNLYRSDQQQATKTIAYVLMPDHVHWLFQLLNNLSLSEAIGQFKGRSTRAIKQLDESIGKVWQADYFDHCIRNEKDLVTQARYIVANPLRAKLVTSIGDYPFWNCVYLTDPPTEKITFPKMQYNIFPKMQS